MNRLLILALCTLTGLVTSQPKMNEVTLESARKTLASEHLPESIGEISLKGFEFSREIETGGGLRVIIVSCNLGGGLLTFRADASLVSSAVTGEIVGVRLLNLRGNESSELLTEEVDGRGTGALR